MYANAGRTKNVSVEEVAIFECASCGRIDWLVNGTHLNNLPVTSSDISVTSGLAGDESTRISTLSIVGRSAYNDTSIECRADGALQHLPPVKLFVHARPCPGMLLNNVYIVYNVFLCVYIYT